MSDRGLRAVVGELVEHVRHYDVPDDPEYPAFIDAWCDRIHAASGVPRMQQEMAEMRKALGINEPSAQGVAQRV